MVVAGDDVAKVPITERTVKRRLRRALQAYAYSESL